MKYLLSISIHTALILGFWFVGSVSSVQAQETPAPQSHRCGVGGPGLSWLCTGVMNPMPSNCHEQDEWIGGNSTVCDGQPSGYTCGTAVNRVATCRASAVPTAPQTVPVPSCTGPDCGDLGYTPLEPIPGVKQTGEADFGTFVGSLFRILFILGALIAVARLVAGGIIYMVSEVVDKRGEARKQINSSIWGLVILAGSWLILNTINPDLLDLRIDLPARTTTPSVDTTLSAPNTPAVQRHALDSDFVRSLLNNPDFAGLLFKQDGAGNAAITVNNADLANSSVINILTSFAQGCEAMGDDSPTDSSTYINNGVIYTSGNAEQTIYACGRGFHTGGRF